MPSIAIAILNWNGKKHLQQFLPSVVHYSPDASIHVIDNGSNDDSVAYLKQNFPNVYIVELDKNYGFCEGYNLGLAQIEADYFVILNSDVEVNDNWLNSPISYFESNPQTAAIQPKILSYENKDKLEYAGAAGGYLDRLGLPFCKGRVFHITEKDDLKYNQIRPIFWASGACLFIRSRCFYEAGGFDPLFFAHMEEIDLCWRLQHKGYQIMYMPDSVVYHLGGGTLHKSNPHKTFLNFRNGLFLIYKNIPLSSLIYLLPLRLVVDGIAGVYFLIFGFYKDTFAILQAHFAFYSSIPKLKVTPNKRNIKWWEINSIIWRFYFSRKEEYTKKYLSARQ